MAEEPSLEPTRKKVLVLGKLTELSQLIPAFSTLPLLEDLADEEVQVSNLTADTPFFSTAYAAVLDKEFYFSFPKDVGDVPTVGFSSISTAPKSEEIEEIIDEEEIAEAVMPDASAKMMNLTREEIEYYDMVLCVVPVDKEAALTHTALMPQYIHSIKDTASPHFFNSRVAVLFVSTSNYLNNQQLNHKVNKVISRHKLFTEFNKRAAIYATNAETNAASTLWQDKLNEIVEKHLSLNPIQVDYSPQPSRSYLPFLLMLAGALLMLFISMYLSEHKTLSWALFDKDLDVRILGPKDELGNPVTFYRTQSLSNGTLVFDGSKDASLTLSKIHNTSDYSYTLWFNVMQLPQHKAKFVSVLFENIMVDLDLVAIDSKNGEMELLLDVKNLDHVKTQHLHKFFSLKQGQWYQLSIIKHDTATDREVNVLLNNQVLKSQFSLPEAPVVNKQNRIEAHVYSSAMSKLLVRDIRLYRAALQFGDLWKKTSCEPYKGCFLNLFDVYLHSTEQVGAILIEDLRDLLLKIDSNDVKIKKTLESIENLQRTIYNAKFLNLAPTDGLEANLQDLQNSLKDFQREAARMQSEKNGIIHQLEQIRPVHRLTVGENQDLEDDATLKRLGKRLQQDLDHFVSNQFERLTNEHYAAYPSTIHKKVVDA